MENINVTTLKSIMILKIYKEDILYNTKEMIDVYLLYISDIKNCVWTLFIYYMFLYFQVRCWSSGMILPCHGRDPGSIPGQRNIFFFCKINSIMKLFGIEYM